MRDETMSETLKNKTCTLCTLFDGYNSLLIPSLQRSYAQGRKTAHANEVRAKFLADIRETLETENGSMSLDLIYGGCGEQQKGVFTILDGQQRLTTLFLLYCYFAGVSQGDISWMKQEQTEKSGKKVIQPKFRYETRDSSSDFCSLLTDEKILHGFSDLCLEGKESSGQSTVSSYLKNSRKFLWTWKFDPTIQAMLVMLDAMQEEFRNHNREWFIAKYQALTDRLQKIIYFDCYELNNTLPPDVQYIRMNQRGLRLTDYENFKASLLGFFKGLKVVDNIPDKFLNTFSQNLDNAWIDYFWRRSGSLQDPDAAVFDRQIMWLLRVTIEYYYTMTEHCRRNSTRTTNDETLKILSQREEPMTFFTLKKGNGLFSDKNDTGLWCILMNFKDTMDLLLEVENGLYPEFSEILKDKINILLNYKTGKDAFSYQEHINFYAAFYYLIANKNQNLNEAKACFPAWYRIISNLTKWSDYSHQYQWVGSLNAVRIFLDNHLVDFAKFMRENPQYPYDTASSFHQTQWLEEHIKENLRHISKTWEREIALAEKLFNSQIMLLLEYASVFSGGGKDDAKNYQFAEPTKKQLQDFIYYRDAVWNFCDIWDKAVFPRQALAICDILQSADEKESVYPSEGGQWHFSIDLYKKLKIDISRDPNKPFRDLLKALLDQLKAYSQDSLQAKIEAYVREKIGENREKIQKKEYGGFILNKEITEFTGLNLYNKFDDGAVYLIPEGKAYLRNDFFEYHLFLLKGVVEQKMNESGFAITTKNGIRDLGILPCLKIEKLDITISYNGGSGYCLDAQSQAPRYFSKISDICNELYKIAGTTQ